MKNTIGLYQKRAQTLKQLGFESYDQYLASSLWKNIKAKAYKQHGAKCRCCPAMASLFHHKHYGHDILAGRNLQGLVPLCHDCHTKIEFKADGKKEFDMRKVNQAMRRMIRNNEKQFPKPKQPVKSSVALWDVMVRYGVFHPGDEIDCRKRVDGAEKLYLSMLHL